MIYTPPIFKLNGLNPPPDENFQLCLTEEEEIVSHKIPSRNKAKPKNPHRLAKSIEGNRVSERKYKTLFYLIMIILSLNLLSCFKLLLLIV